MQLMTRNTQSDKVIQVATVLPVDARPLDLATVCTGLPTKLTTWGGTLLAVNPVVKSSIAHVLSLPRVVLRALYFLGLSLRPFLGAFRAFGYSVRLTVFSKFFVSGFRVTSHVTKRTFSYFGRRTIVGRPAFRAVGLNHPFYLRMELGEMQVW